MGIKYVRGWGGARISLSRGSVLSREYFPSSLKHKTDGFLKRSYRHGFTKEIFHIQTITDSVTYDLTWLKPQTIVSITYYHLNDYSMMHSVRGHQFQLPNCISNFTSYLSL